MYVMTSRGFLVVGGLVLVLLASAGMTFLGPTADVSPMGSFMYFDMAENWAHLVIGIILLVSAFTLGANSQKWIVVVVGMIAVLVGLYSLAVSSELFGAMLQNPADTVLHVVLGAWALLAAFARGL